MIEGLKDIVHNKRLTLLNVQGIYSIIDSRKNTIDYISKIQDKYSFDLVNQEHRYMENFLSQYIDNSNLSFERWMCGNGSNISGYLTFKNKNNNTDIRRAG